MHRPLRTTLRFLAGLISLIVLTNLIFTDIPVMCGLLFMDGPDPKRPGHMIGYGPSPLSLLAEISLLVLSVYLYIRAARIMR